MRTTGLLGVLIAMGALFAPASAGAAERGFRPFVQSEPGGQQFRKEDGSLQRGGRELRRDRRGERHHGRLTEEERRELHRDLDRAHREIYHPKRP
jgi:hypothetical protein